MELLESCAKPMIYKCLYNIYNMIYGLLHYNWGMVGGDEY